MPVSTHERSITVKTMTILKVVGIFAGLWFLWLVRDVLTLLVVALFLAALMHPAARWGAKHRIPKGVTVLAVYLLLLILVAIAFAVIIPTLGQQIGQLSPGAGSSINAAIAEALSKLRAVTAQVDVSKSLSVGGVGSLQQGIQTVFRLFEALTNVFGGFAGFAIVLAMAFYMVVQDQEAIHAFRNFVPEPYQEWSANVIRLIEEKIGRWLSGQLILSLIIGLCYYVGLLALGIDSPLALAVFGSFTEFIPYLGPILGGLAVVIVAFGASSLKALLALGFVVLIQQLESHILVPKVMQKALGLNPLACIVAILVGAKLFGIVGALLAIPVATALSVFLLELYHLHQERHSR